MGLEVCLHGNLKFYTQLVECGYGVREDGLGCFLGVLAAFYCWVSVGVEVD